MYRPLAPCPGCSRHVRLDDAACPFCRTVFTAARPAPVPAAPPRRLSRAALFTFVATVGGAACSSTVTATDAGGADVPAAADRPVVADAGQPADAGPADDGGFASLYGDPAYDAGGPDDDGGIAVEYGGPFPVDAGAPDDDGGSNADYGAPPPRDAGFFPPYGTPPPRDGGEI